MYETEGSRPQSESCKEPDWEAEIAKATKDFDVIIKFKACLIAFISTIGARSFKRKESSLPELLGTVLLDIIDREKRIAFLMEKVEGKKG